MSPPNEDSAYNRGREDDFVNRMIREAELDAILHPETQSEDRELEEADHAQD